MFRFELCVGGLAWNEGHVRRVDPQKARFAGRMVGGTVNADFFVDRLEAVAHRAISYPVIGRRLMKDLDRRALVGDAGASNTRGASILPADVSAAKPSATRSRESTVPPTILAPYSSA